MVVIPIPSEYSDSQANYDVAISSHEVTVAEFRRFMPQFETQVPSTDNCPAHGISWYQAAAYCNWLSGQEGIPEDQWVYEPSANGWFEEGMRIKENAHELVGYRLPTTSEWKLACRADTSSSLSFGEPLVLLEDYGPHGQMRPVEELLPNAYGLFDLHGNVQEWSQNDNRGIISSDVVGNSETRICCGGSFIDPLSEIQTDKQFYWYVTNTYFAHGFRPLRSLPSSR